MLSAENFSDLLITFSFLAKFTNQVRERHQFALEGLGVSGRKWWIHAPIKGEIAPRPLTSGNQVSCDTQAVERKTLVGPSRRACWHRSGAAVGGATGAVRVRRARRPRTAFRCPSSCQSNVLKTVPNSEPEKGFCKKEQRRGCPVTSVNLSRWPDIRKSEPLQPSAWARFATSRPVISGM